MIGVVKINIPSFPMNGVPKGTLGSEMIAFVVMGDLYASLKSAGYTFCLRSILSYSLGASFGMGGDNYLLASFEFHGLSEDNQVLLMMRHNFDFGHDLEQYTSAISSGCGWEVP